MKNDERMATGIVYIKIVVTSTKNIVKKTVSKRFMALAVLGQWRETINTKTLYNSYF